MLTELEAGTSENPFFTQLVQEQPLEHEVRAVFGRLPASAPLHDPGVVADIVHDPAPSRSPWLEAAVRSAGLAEQQEFRDQHPDLFPFRASARAALRAPAAVPPSLVKEQSARDATAIPVVLSGLISATPTGSINLQLRKQLDQ